MISDMKESDRQYQSTMARFAASLENLSQTVSTMFGIMNGGIVQHHAPRNPNWQQGNLGQQVMYAAPVTSNSIIHNNSNQEPIPDIGMF